MPDVCGDDGERGLGISVRLRAQTRTTDPTPHRTRKTVMQADKAITTFRLRTKQHSLKEIDVILKRNERKVGKKLRAK